MGFRKGVLAALLSFIGYSSSDGAVFNIVPVRGDLGPGKNSVVFTVSNDNSEPIVIQTETMVWSQHDGHDTYDPTRELLVTPPIFTLPPKGQQILRVGLRRSPDPQQELSYRLFLNETPGPPDPSFRGVRMALRVGLPIFVEPATSAALPVLHWKINLSAPGQWTVRLDNTGNAHVQVAQLRLQVGEKSVADTPEVAYVLPKQYHEWHLRVPSSVVSDHVRLLALVDGKSVETILSIEGKSADK